MQFFLYQLTETVGCLDGDLLGDDVGFVVGGAVYQYWNKRNGERTTQSRNWYVTINSSREDMYIIYSHVGVTGDLVGDFEGDVVGGGVMGSLEPKV